MTQSKLLLLDFDGTLCLGDDPVLAYAGQVDRILKERSLNGPGGRTVREVAEAAFAQNSLLVEEIAYDDAGSPAAVAADPTPDAGQAHPVSWPLQDGYQLVQLLAAQSGLSNEEAGSAFRQARRDLLAAGLENSDLHTPAEAPGLLEEVRSSGVSAVLATNSPAEGFELWLRALGLQDSFDAVINSAQKPFGMPKVLERALHAAPGVASLHKIFSVGDIWANDLAHVSDLGGQTVLIDRFSTGLGDPHWRVDNFSQAAPVIRRWGG